MIADRHHVGPVRRRHLEVVAEPARPRPYDWALDPDPDVIVAGSPTAQAIASLLDQYVPGVVAAGRDAAVLLRGER